MHFYQLSIYMRYLLLLLVSSVNLRPHQIIFYLFSCFFCFFLLFSLLPVNHSGFYLQYLYLTLTIYNICVVSDLTQ